MSAITLEAPTQHPLDNKNLIDDVLWHRLVNRIVRDEAIDVETAEQIMDQALGFLRLCAESRGAGYSPSPMVDIGWHTFILYTRPYAEFCERVAGRFIHHDPSDVPGQDYSGAPTLGDTVSAMRRLGISVNEDFWVVASDTNYCSDSSTGSPQDCKENE